MIQGFRCDARGVSVGRVGLYTVARMVAKGSPLVPAWTRLFCNTLDATLFKGRRAERDHCNHESS